VANTGPVHLDCRQIAGAVAIRRMESVLKRIRGGARMVIVRTDEPEVVDLIRRWAEAGCARYSVCPRELDTVIRVFLLPHDFDAHPFLAWRPVIMASDLTATPPPL
jgi:hypothetical protein